MHIPPSVDMEQVRKTTSAGKLKEVFRLTQGQLDAILKSINERYHQTKKTKEAEVGWDIKR